MNDLLLHPQTRTAVESVISGGSHAVLVVGELGSGKQALAAAIAAELLGTSLDVAPYYLHVQGVAKSIGIEQIREIQKFVQLKTTGTRTIRRVITLDQADSMTTEAQNALLKILEEPPIDTVLILVTHKPQSLRPTIHSRTQKVTVIPPAKVDVLAYFKTQGKSSVEIEKAYVVSNGQMGLMTALLDGNTEHVLAAHIVTAKQLYGMSSFERLTTVDELSKAKETLPDLLFACKRICLSALEQAAINNQAPAAKSWHRQLKLVLRTESALKYNPNTKLLLTDLFISM